jgi:hypothetical protein
MTIGTAGFENRRGGNSTRGSNPFSSADFERLRDRLEVLPRLLDTNGHGLGHGGSATGVQLRAGLSDRALQAVRREVGVAARRGARQVPEVRGDLLDAPGASPRAGNEVRRAGVAQVVEADVPRDPFVSSCAAPGASGRSDSSPARTFTEEANTAFQDTHNNRSERELRREAVGRKNWLFVGSDDGAKWNATFVSLIASCQQHKLEPWAYLRDLFCLLPAWPAHRVLELAPKHWRQTCEQPEVQRRLAADRLRSISQVTPHAVESAQPSG